MLYVSPTEGNELVKQHYLRLAGRYDGQRLHHAGTLYDPNTGEATILVDNSLPPEIQKIYELHERVQHRRIREYVNATGRPKEGIMPHAHFEGLEAGKRLARRLKVLPAYLKVRGE